MIRHLTAGDFNAMPWANGRGQTVELARAERDGAMLWRLSRAMVVQDGDFSVFPGVQRNLTLISGPGFDLRGAVSLRADLLRPVEFAGDAAVRAEGVLGPCEDFNAMVRRGVMAAQVSVRNGGLLAGGLAALFALEEIRVAGIGVGQGELVLTDERVEFGGRAIVVALTGPGASL